MVDYTTKSNTSLTIPDNIISSTSATSASIDANDTLLNGGMLWFNDLTLTDPTFIFPLAIGLTNIFNIEVI